MSNRRKTEEAVEDKYALPHLWLRHLAQGLVTSLTFSELRMEQVAQMWVEGYGRRVAP